jgi:hypothetical protein
VASKKVQPKGFRALRDDLLAKTGKSKQWLSQEVAKRTRRIAMSVRVAQAVVAHDSGIRVDRYLAGNELADVQQAIRDLNHGGAPTAPPGRATAGPTSRRSGRAGKALAYSARTISFKGAKVSISDTFLSRTKLAEAQAMANIYPLLYVLENSIREVIRRVMVAQFGDDWWDTKITGGKLNALRDQVAGRKKTENSNSWHQRRGAHEIDYLDFKNLLVVAESKPDLFFPVLLGERDWFKQFFRELIPSRNVLCHMNPLSRTNEADVALKLRRWEEHLKNRRVDLEAATMPSIGAR